MLPHWGEIRDGANSPPRIYICVLNSESEFNTQIGSDTVGGDVAAERAGVAHTEVHDLAQGGINTQADRTHTAEFFTLEFGRTGVADGHLGSRFLIAEELRVTDIGLNLHGYGTGRKRHSTAHTEVQSTDVLIFEFGLDVMTCHMFVEAVGRGTEVAQAGIRFNLICIGVQALVAHFPEQLEDIGVVAHGVGTDSVAEHEVALAVGSV